MAEALKRCSCGTWSPAAATACVACGEPLGLPARVQCTCGYTILADVRGICPACGAALSSEFLGGAPLPAVKEGMPGIANAQSLPEPPAESAGFLSEDQVFQLGKKRVHHMRVEDGVLGALLLMVSLDFFRAPRMMPYAVIGGISGLVNLVLAASLGPGTAQVGHTHRWLSLLGLTAGVAVVAALLLIEPGRSAPSTDGLLQLWTLVDPQNRIPWCALALLVAPVLVFPIRALEALSRVEVRAYLGMDPAPSAPIPLAAVRGQSQAASRAGAVVAATSASLGCVSGIAVIVVPVLVVIAALVYIINHLGSHNAH